ncbi:hypothetical protein HK098_002291 [Nowakowskiella sp. JEL0407]|nr:hypothetical protein HK098_002291 [Nowakowskiella sp. JEL0407]
MPPLNFKTQHVENQEFNMSNASSLSAISGNSFSQSITGLHSSIWDDLGAPFLGEYTDGKRKDPPSITSLYLPNDIIKKQRTQFSSDLPKPSTISPTSDIASTGYVLPINTLPQRSFPSPTFQYAEERVAPNGSILSSANLNVNLNAYRPSSPTIMSFQNTPYSITGNVSSVGLSPGAIGGISQHSVPNQQFATTVMGPSLRPPHYPQNIIQQPIITGNSSQGTNIPKQVIAYPVPTPSNAIVLPLQKPNLYTRSPELRISHKLAERKRRKEIKDLFDELQEVLSKADDPKLRPCGNFSGGGDSGKNVDDSGKKASKGEILSKSIDQITALREENQKLRERLDSLN